MNYWRKVFVQSVIRLEIKICCVSLVLIPFILSAYFPPLTKNNIVVKLTIKLFAQDIGPLLGLKLSNHPKNQQLTSTLFEIKKKLKYCKRKMHIIYSLNQSISNNREICHLEWASNFPMEQKSSFQLKQGNNYH